MRNLRTGLLTLVMFVVAFGVVLAQEANRSMVSFRNDRVFVGMTNHFRVVAQQLGPVRLDQLSAVLLTYGEEEEPAPIVLKIEQRGNQFAVHPKQIGTVSITIQLEERIERYSFHTKLLDAVSKVGNWDAGTVGRIPAIAFKAQRGLYALLEGYDICGKCNVISYEVVRVASGLGAEIISNNGGDWEPATAELIKKGQPGDRYIFTKIRYRCPGALVDQLAETLSFELK
ncbi:MAG: GldM family protein [Lewinella sp.]